MKKIILILVLNFLSAFTNDNNYILTDAKSEDLQKTCRSLVFGYYNDMQSLAGANLSDVQKDSLEESTCKEYFQNGGTRIEKDIDSLAKPDYNIKDYLDNVSLLFNKLKNVEITVDDSNINISKVYYKDGKYILVASVEREIVTTPDNSIDPQTDKRLVDIYFGFTPASKLKIFSIQNHRDDIFKGMSPVPLVHEPVTASKNEAKPYFTFDIKPKRAEVIIDGLTVLNNDSRVPTNIGKHTVEIIAPNYYPEKFEVNVTGTGDQPIDLKLTKKEGYLAINSNDIDIIDGEVSIDGNLVGNVPFSNYLLNVGAHRVEIKGRNYFHKTFWVTISQENVTYLNIQNNSVRPFTWWDGNTFAFSRTYPTLYIAYPPRTYIAYPPGYWSRPAAEHREFEKSRNVARMEIRNKIASHRIPYAPSTHQTTISRREAKKIAKRQRKEERRAQRTHLRAQKQKNVKNFQRNTRSTSSKSSNFLKSFQKNVTNSIRNNQQNRPENKSNQQNKQSKQKQSKQK